jgi:hypothetical protein
MSSNSNTYETILNLDPYIKMCDSDENLTLYSYSNLTDEQKQEEKYIKHEEFINNTRGVVFDKDKNLIFQSFNKPDEISVADDSSLDTLISYIEKEKGGLGNCKIYDSHEGALVRMFFYENKWYICTHRKLNAFKSKWSSPESYGTSFKKALIYQSENNESLKNMLSEFDNESTLDCFYNLLDPSKQYVFLVKNTSFNRIVCDPPENPMMYHVGTFKDGILIEDEINDIGIYTLETRCLDTMDVIKDYVNNINYKDITGLILFLPGNIQVKIHNKDYLEMYKVRGNEPSIKFRYLQVRNDRRLCLALKNLYPAYIEDFDAYEMYIRELCRNIHDSYMKRFVYKEQLTVPNVEYKIMRIAHSWYHEDKINRKVTKQIVFEIINDQNASIVNQLIKLYKQQLKTDNNERQNNYKDSKSEIKSDDGPGLLK